MLGRHINENEADIFVFQVVPSRWYLAKLEDRVFPGFNTSVVVNFPPLLSIFDLGDGQNIGTLRILHDAVTFDFSFPSEFSKVPVY